MSDTVKIQVMSGDASSVGKEGYMIVRGQNVVAFYLDVWNVPSGRLHFLCSCQTTLDYSTFEQYDYPSLGLDEDDGGDTFVEIAFPEFPGWQVHSVNGGKTLSICLVKHD